MTARDYALIQLDARDLPGWRPVLPHSGPSTPPGDPRDRALAEQIINGVIQNLLLLQHLVHHHAGRPLHRIDSLVQKILAIALYQLRFLDRIPPSAAVDEAVEQARRFRRRKAAGFVNGLLRNALRAGDPPLPDPEHDPRAHAEVALSHPAALFERMTALFGVADALRLCRHNNAEPPTIIRLFHGASRDQLSVDGVSVLAHVQAGMLVIQGARQPLLAEWARRGLAQVQDPTSALVVEQLDIQPGQAILDRCAGLGTKTLQMRDRLGESGSIVAVDPNGGRCEALRRIVAARGIRNIAIHQVDMLSKIRVTLPQQFDRVLVDVPCSNSGVLPRRPEAKYHQQDRALRSLSRLQKAILDDTAPSVAQGGQLLYSTCSIWPEENQQIVEAFLSGDSQFRLVRQHFSPPSLDQNPATYRDGGYYALLERVL